MTGKLQIIADIELADIDSLELTRETLEGMLYEVSWGERDAKLSATLTDEHGEIVRATE